MQRNTILFSLAVTGVLTVTVLLTQHVPSSASVSDSSAQATASLLYTTPAASATANLQPVTHTATRPAESLLSGTSAADVDIPKSLSTDADGNLIVDEGVRELMDFFLALEGERSKDEIRALFTHAANAQCSARCAAQALAIYDQYLDYLDAMQAETLAAQATDDLRTRVEMVKNLRDQLLGTDLAQALFGYEDDYDQLRSAQWAIHNDRSLTPEEKHAALNALQRNQPEALTQRELQTRIPQSLHRLTQTFQNENTDPDTRLHAYAAIAGPEAAERLVALEQTRIQWDQRYQQYRAELNSVTSTGLAKADQAEEIARLRLRYFSEQESLRVAALDRINDEAR